MANEHGLSLVAAIRRAEKTNKCIRRKSWNKNIGIWINGDTLCDASYGFKSVNDYEMSMVDNYLANDWEVVDLESLKGE